MLVDRSLAELLVDEVSDWAVIVEALLEKEAIDPATLPVHILVPLR